MRQISNLKRGTRLNKDDLLENGNYPVISGGQNIFGYLDKTNFDKDMITISRVGSAGAVMYQNYPFFATDLCFVVQANDELVLPKYLYYLLLTNQHKLDKLKTSSTLASIVGKDLEALKLSVPAMIVQRKIVDFLDLLGFYGTDITGSLPTEIQLRQQQYEYYLNAIFQNCDNDTPKK